MPQTGVGAKGQPVKEDFGRAVLNHLLLFSLSPWFPLLTPNFLIQLTPSFPANDNSIYVICCLSIIARFF